MQTDACSGNVSDASSDRRKHARYRFCVPLTIHSTSGAEIRAISIEISVSGLSAITADSLKLGESVELEPVCAGRVSALVRRNVGRVYGFEFMNLTAEQVAEITQSCKTRAQYHGRSLGI